MKKISCKFYKRGLVAVLALVGAAGLASVSNAAQAANTGSVDFNLSIKDSLGLSVSANKVSMTLNPAIEAKSFSTTSLTTTVGTNNPHGYTLTVSANGTSLLEKDDNTLQIPTLTAAVDETAFKALTDSRWGYKNSKSTVSTTNFLPFTSGAIISSAEEAVNADVANLVFGTHVGYSTAAGTYELALNFTATANPGFTYMQGMDPSMCTANEATLVMDKRDEKEYYVRRLADGKCWMISNLNLAGGTKLYSDTSNVPAGYPESGGNPYYTLPASSTSGFSDDSTAYVYNSGKETNSQADCTSSQPCNSYYSWLAATAGGKNSSGSSVTSDGGMTAYSVCPSGWKLPSATTDGIARDSGGYTGGDFYKMAIQYGLNSSNYYENPDNAPKFYDNAGPGTSPNFLLAGYYYGGSFHSGGSYGYYWSSSSRSGTNAYYLNFNSGYVNSADNNGRRRGFSVRCVLAE